MTPYVVALMALQVHADEDGFVDLAAAVRRSGLPAQEFSACLSKLVRCDIVRSANRTKGVAGPMPETCFQLVEAYR